MERFGSSSRSSQPRASGATFAHTEQRRSISCSCYQSFASFLVQPTQHFLPFNTDLSVDYHGNGRRFEVFGSDLLVLAPLMQLHFLQNVKLSFLHAHWLLFFCALKWCTITDLILRICLHTS